MKVESHGDRIKGIADGLAGEAKRRFGPERAQDLQSAINRTASELAVIASFEIPFDTIPAFYVHASD